MLNRDVIYPGSIALNGDIFDGILASDLKRYTPDVLASRFRGRRDIVNSVLDYATDLLYPYKEKIAFIGTGNHELEMLKRHGFDPIAALCNNLSVTYGGVSGFLQYKIGKHPYTIYYHHGAGRGSSLYSALSSLEKRTSWIQADAIWEGHRHCRFVADTVRIDPTHKGSSIVRPVKLIATGSYLKMYNSLGGGEVQGKHANYAVEQAYRPQGVGGVALQLVDKGKTLDVSIVI